MLDYASLQLLSYAMEKTGDDPYKIYEYFQTPQVFETITGNIAIYNGVDFLSPIEITQY
jgi:ABC-type branched-subunit amino acid transport system substrate-binding protein